MSIPPVPFLAKTVVSWTGEQEGDLGFIEGEVVKVFHIVDELWWQGSLSRNDAEGIFPKDFVQIIERSVTPSASTTPRNSTTTTPVKEYRSSRNSPYKSTGNALPALKLMTALVDSSFERRDDKKRLSQLYSQYVLNLGLTKAHTSDNLRSLARDSCRERETYKQNDSFRESEYKDEVCNKSFKEDEFLQSISAKKQQLEMELHHLRKLQRMHKQYLEDSFVSEDLISSRNGPSDMGAGFDSDSDDAPPPPAHKAVPFDADDFRMSAATEDVLHYDDLKASIKSLQSDVLNLSELSATSAGSLMRHKQNPRHEVDLDMRRLTIDETNEVFQDKKTKPNIFKMLMKKKPEQNLMEQRLGASADSWQTVRQDVNRAHSLTLLDKQARTKRAVREGPNFIVKPLEGISEINVSEEFGDGVCDLRCNVRKVADFLERYPAGIDLNELVAAVGVKFSSSVDQIRAVLVHLSQYRILEEGDRISQAKPRLAEVMAKKEATVFQINYLFKKVLEALRIPSEVVFGFWKKPNEFYHSDQYVVNHCWLSVMVEGNAGGCFRMVDILCFQNGSICNRPGNNDFYFLTEPLSFVSTHIPTVVELQHVCPPVDLTVAYHLPRMYLGFDSNKLSFVNFNNALTRMADLECFEADISLPVDVELFTLIKTSRTTSNDYTLCQIKWEGNRRIARIKAVLPKGENIGVLQIFAGPKGLQTHFDNIHELACVIPLHHAGSNRSCKFVPRYPTIQSQNNDLYVRHPQVAGLSVRNPYNFEIDVHPASGMNLASVGQDFKLVIESPSGKYTRLSKEDHSRPFGTYKANIVCQEPGVYRALVIGDSGNSWYVFAQWECGAGAE